MDGEKAYNKNSRLKFRQEKYHICEREHCCHCSTHSDSKRSSHSRSNRRRTSSRWPREARDYSCAKNRPCHCPPNHGKTVSYSGHKSPPIFRTNSDIFYEYKFTLSRKHYLTRFSRRSFENHDRKAEKYYCRSVTHDFKNNFTKEKTLGQVCQRVKESQC